MKKFIVFILTLCLTVSVFQMPAFAAEPYELLPVDVVYYPNHMEIRKIYEMAASVDPANIPRSNFKRDDINYRCTDILRQVVIGDETKPHTEIETVSSVKNDMATILKILPPTKEIVTEDGFSGTLHLSTSSIKTEVSGYGSTSSAVSVTRSYPNLYDMDTQYIPKSVTESSITYTLSDIQWKSDNTYNIDDYEIGNRYTATAVYSGTKTSSYVKGYKVTAEYTGEVCRTGVSVIRYTVIFSGTKIEPPQPVTVPTTVPEPETVTEAKPETEIDSYSETLIETEIQADTDSGFNWLIAVIPLALLAAASTAGAIYIF